MEGGLNVLSFSSSSAAYENCIYEIKERKIKAFVLTSIIFCVVMFCTPVLSNTVYVNWDGSGEYATIQDAINASVDGDTVIVSPGVYVENVSFGGKDITLTSTDPADRDIVASTVIKAKRNSTGFGTVILFSGNETSDCKLTGFTITGGNGSYSSSPAIRGSYLSYNNTAIISNCIITGNNTNPTSQSGTISYCNGTIVNCVIYGNSPGSVLRECDADIINCTFAGDSVGFVYCNGMISNCIVWPNYDGPYFSVDCSVPTYSCIKNWTGGGTGNISTLPGFVDADNGNFRMLPGSPCIDAGDNAAVPSDVLKDIDGRQRLLDDPNTIDTGNGTAPLVDMGAYEFLPEAWLGVSEDSFAATIHEGDTEILEREFEVVNEGNVELNWQINEGCGWLSCDILSGYLEAGQRQIINISVDGSALGVGDHNCQILITSSEAINSPKVVDFDLRVVDPKVVPTEYATIQDAVDAAVFDDVVLVLDGVYTGTGNVNVNLNDKAIAVKSQSGAKNCIIDCEGQSGGVRFVDCENGTVLDGFTVINGFAGNGGAVRIVNSSVTIKNCIFKGNSATENGGAVYSSSGSDVVIEGCKFIDNRAELDGGGLYGDDYSLVTVKDCDFIGNTAYSGGGFYGYDCSEVTITQSKFTGNVGGNYGGGICLTMLEYSRFSITNCVVENNQAGRGGGIHLDLAWSSYDDNYSSGTIANCLIANNQAGFGGGIRCLDDSDKLGIFNCTFAGNQAGEDEGSAIWHGAGASVENCLFVGNSIPVFEDYMPGKTCYCYYGDDQADDFLLMEIIIGNNNNQMGDAKPTGDHHLQADSPCIDAGDPNGLYDEQVDADGEPRVVGLRVDIGWDEFLDSDGDNMGDYWELKFFDTLEDGVAGNDTDGDGTNDLGEYNDSTNPLGPYYAATDGDDQWDGLTPQWDGTHGPKATIQEAIDLTVNGDTVVVMDGTYTGGGNRDITYRGKAITVKSENGPRNCIINCQGSADSHHRGFYLHDKETQDSVIDGFAIINGYLDSFGSHPSSISEGGGIFCLGAGPTIENCIIKNCFTSNFGGAIAVTEFFDHNIQEFFYPSPVIRNTIITGNTTITANVSLGISNALMENCTIVGNKASAYGGGVSLWHQEGYSPKIRNCIIRDNQAPEGSQIISGSSTSGYIKLAVEYSNVEGGLEDIFSFTDNGFIWGPGNIDVDPLFVNPGYWDGDDWVEGDYHLKSQGWRWDVDSDQWAWDDVTSPCIDTGNPGSPLRTEPMTVYVDLLNRFGENIRINMGAYGGTAEASMPPYDWAILSDINNDAVCDIYDLMHFARYWLDDDEAIPADFNRDGSVDLADFALLVYDWMYQAIR